MEDNKTQTISEHNTESNQIHSIKKKFRFYSIFGKIISILIIIGGLLYTGYFLGTRNNQTGEKTINTDKSSPTKTQTAQVASPTPFDVGFQINENTVSFTRVNGEVYMRYRDKIYSEEAASKNDPSLTNLPDPNSHKWLGLIDAPSNLEINSFNELFDFKTLPNKQNFIFITRWPTTGINTSYNVFFYDAYKQSSKNDLLFSNGQDSGQEYFVPRINQISPNDKYVAFNMFACWNCGGHKPETLLLELETKQTKRIGKTSHFNWKDDGNYEYKEYVVIECDQPLEVPGECSQDPDSLPLKSGKF